MPPEPLPAAAPFAVVVNDDPTQLNVLAGLVRKAGLEPRAFAGAEAALATMSAGAPPSLIVTDLYMPGLDGWRFCRLLRSPEYAAFNQVPILVVSATYSGAEAAGIAADLGAEAFLSSPVDGRRFCAEVRAILNGEQLRKPLRVLIVDDSALFCELLQQLFTRHGYEADTAFTVHAATVAFEKTAYDVAVLDYHLPDGHGDTLLEMFRAQRPDCVCLMMTIDPGPELALEWMKRGAAAYLKKPFQLEYVIELCTRARRERALLRAQDLLEVRTRELQKSEERYRTIVENSGEGIAFVNAEERFVFANSAAEEIFGVGSGGLEGRNLEQFVSAEQYRLLQQETALRVHGKTSTYELEVVQPNGALRNIIVTAVPQYDRETGFVGTHGVFRDITTRKLAEAEKIKLEAQFQQAQKMESVGRLAGGVAHDFNNMLQAILGNVDLALEEIPPGGAIRESLEEIRNCARRSADLTRQLLTFARRQTIAPVVLDLNATVEDLLKMLRRLIGEDIDLVWLPAKGLGLVKMDPTQVDQILANLCVNARDAIGGVGKVTIETANTVFDAAYCAEHPDFVAGEYVRLAVSDNGCGMDKVTLAQIFEPFFTTKGMGEGTGLGLATVYGIVKQNSGFLNVYSEPGYGTTFTLFLPRHAGQVTATGFDTATEIARSLGETVLLVEDEPAVRGIARVILERLGYSVLAASTPNEAIRLAETHVGEINLLITDVVMPEMNGRDLERRISALRPKLRCLYMSGYTADVIGHHGVLETGVHFIQKPFSMVTLAAKAREALGAAGGA